MFPHREPPFHADWWSIDRSAPILLMLLVLAVVVWAVVRFTRQPRAVPAGGVDTGAGRSFPAAIADPAVEQVRQRYARGELDRDTFLQIVRDLSPGSVEVGATDEPPPSATP
jgi:uncharacterized membrane protein